MNDINVGIITEGETDQYLLNEIVCTILDKRKNCLNLQPNLHNDNPGWAGVWSFCRDNISSLGIADYMQNAGAPLDVLIIALDGDMTTEGSIYCTPSNSPCSVDKSADALACHYSRAIKSPFEKCIFPSAQKLPHIPVELRVTFIKDKILEWCNIQTGQAPTGLIITIPCDMMEAWIISAKVGPIIEGTPVEEYSSPFIRFVCQQRNFCGWEPFFNKEVFFKRFVKDTIQSWNQVIAHCPQAKKLNDALINIKTTFESKEAS